MRRLTPHRSHTVAALVPSPARLHPLAPYLESICGLSPDAVAVANDAARRLGRPLAEVLYAQYSVSHRDVIRAQAAMTGAEIVDPTKAPCDVRLIHQFGPAKALGLRLLPWRRIGGTVIVLTTSPDVFEKHYNALQADFDDVRMALTTEDQLVRAVTQQSASHLAHRAEHRVDAIDSCRNWSSRRTLAAGLAVVAGLGLAAAMSPVAMFAALTILTVVILALNVGFKVAAAIVSGRAVREGHASHDATLARLPVITLLIPLYREKAIAEHLLARLEAIDYPRELMDVCLVLEADDDTTRAALGRVSLLTWVRPVVVPPGTIKTKPRALNYALDFARGSIIGVYDAEDAPARDQLRRVADHFANADPKVACLQGTLDYYNSSANWLTRCFTIEYASWFRVILPGYARMELIVPLGGTTLFFRRNILERLGGWDAHNVTEDADLGIRLARRGYRTEFINTVTEEEANGRFWPWVKQRSRWLKGYAITYGVHMRNPRQLLGEVGWWRFLGLNVLFAGTLAQFLLSPVLWSFWLLPFGLPHPVADILPIWAFWSLVGLFVLTELANLFIAWVGLRRGGKSALWPWAISLQAYFPLGTIAVYKGLIELAWRPFYWDKTAHGLLMPQATLPPEPSLRPTSNA